MKPPKMQVHGRFWMERGSSAFLGRGRVDLLEKIEASHSIAEAARQLGMSYKTAWDMVAAMNNLADQSLVVRSKGGRQGGGTLLTDYGRQVITAFRAMEREYETMLAVLEKRYPDFNNWKTLEHRLQLRTSARNQLSATIQILDIVGHQVQVELDLGAGLSLQAQLTQSSAEALDLHIGRQVIALIKAPAIALSDKPATDAQTLPGVVAHIMRDDESGSGHPGGTEITLSLASGHTLVVTLDAAAHVPPIGTQVYAAIDPRLIIVAVTD